VLQVECKKAQPKEVMLPANLAKTRAAGRGAYGELLMLNPATAAVTAAAGGLPPGAGASSLAASPAAVYRYTPYPLPTAAAPHPVGVGLHAAMVPIAVAPSRAASNPNCLQYTPATNLYNMAGAVQAAASCKRAFAAALRPHPTPASATALTYSMSELLGVQGLDVSAIYHPAVPAAVGL
jgi:hypothetical protein